MPQHFSPEEPRLRVIAAGRTATGRVLECNQDAIALCEPPDQLLRAQFGWLYLLADGVGGQAAGEVASSLAIETVAAAYYSEWAPIQQAAKSTFQPGGKVSHLDGESAVLTAPIIQLQRAFLAAHTRIREVASHKQKYANMLTTCLAAVVKGNHLLIAHVGDSRAYLIRPASASGLPIIPLTQDHSLARILVEFDILTSEAIYTSPARHIILRALGIEDPEMACPDLTTCLVQAGDHLLLCCDGLWSQLSEHQLAMVVSSKSPPEACAELIRLANEAGGNYNVSAIVLSFLKCVSQPK
jgi:serine/threonine protein phosphatase PrpC